MNKTYDVIILGGGPAGLSAGLYSGRSCLSALIIEKGQDGGQIALTDEIENYPGQIIDGETGFSLVSRMTAQVEKFGVERIQATVKSVELEGEVKVVKTASDTFLAKNIIIATGAKARPIGCKNEKLYIGRGVSYCATCDANFFRGLEVFVVGGGDSAIEEAIYLSKFARKVTVVHRRDKLRAAKSIQEKAFANEKIEFLWDSVVDELGGEEILTEVSVKNVKTGALTKYTASEKDGLFGVFGFIGTVPNSSLFKDMVEVDESDYIITDEDMHTNVSGVYAVGDIRVKSLRQVVTAVADGAIAAIQVERSLL